ncbi:methyl-accepting chemotaxis protein [Rhizobium rhizoryzae]|uniref:Methyl-accepting chemotaxis protein n=1 Tax=Rhizobium rhizoryzae TaxID=451876 RepID=A0A7W6LM76_9HYPH|nr:methyl-accepting chemotaxis protein [Rhizobium rhizoryzae]MBB4145661.1 methyl-accepting chemotaxis protein [Rhizobium rhizoryzae]
MIIKLSFRQSLITLALVPLAALAGLGADIGFASYEDYEKLKRADGMAKLAYAAGELTMVMPMETTGPVADRPKNRPKTDAAFKEIVNRLAALPGLGYDDRAMSKLADNLETAYSKMPEYRQQLDAGDNNPQLPLRYALPISTAALAVAGRASSLTDDMAVSHDVRGSIAGMRINEGYFSLNRMGQVFIRNGSFTRSEQARLDSALAQIRHFEPTFREFVSPELVSRYDSFFNTSDGKIITDLITAMESTENFKGRADDLGPFINAMNNRRDVVAEILRENGSTLITRAEARMSAAYGSMLLIIGGMSLFVISVVVLSIYITCSLSSTIRGIGRSMNNLADGDTSSTIPYTDLNDEIGAMAQSVEVFRQAAVRNAELEAETTGNRARMEAERAELQAQAENEAQERLRQATSALAGSLRRLANGDLLCDIQQPLAPQFETLRSDFNASVAQLRDTLRAVGATVTTVAGGSREISDASDNLAKRTEQQAASLEETAAALEEITSNVTSTSRRTGEARIVVRDARDQAERSGAVVRNAVTAMERIEQASRQISNIIGVIDEIAFQTNLLALNAGVEAARAGEAGKGFAVVAQEVRELAQRSANAAKEIKGLIANSTAAVSEGVKLVSETGQGLTAIEQLVLTINTHMDAIATAAHEQSNGLTEVNTAVNHMDQATQQNAAMVEEMNAAGAGLAGESQKLHELISCFQLVHGLGSNSQSAATMLALSSAKAAPL